MNVDRQFSATLPNFQKVGHNFLNADAVIALAFLFTNMGIFSLYVIQDY